MIPTFKLTLATIGLLGSLSALAAPVTINFDSLGSGVTVTNQFPEATFSSNAGFRVVTSAQNIGNSPPNFICTAAVGGSIDCTHDVFVDFTSAVNGLSFKAIGDDAVGTVAVVDVFDIGGLLGTVNVVADSVFFTPTLVDLAAFSNVTRIAIRNVTDPGGLGWDDFSFNSGSGTVPEPASLALVGLALAIGGLAGRRRA